MTTSREFPLEVADRCQVEEIRDRQRRGERMWEDIDLDRSRFFVHRADSKLIAWVGIEFDAPNALLRSLFTDPAYRNQGIGRQLVRGAENEAARWGIRAVYLFSTGAGAFFASLGYSELPVAAAVAAVRNTPQVQWYLDHPSLLAAEVTYVRRL